MGDAGWTRACGLRARRARRDRRQARDRCHSCLRACCTSRRARRQSYGQASDEEAEDFAAEEPGEAQGKTLRKRRLVLVSFVYRQLLCSVVFLTRAPTELL